MSLFYITPGFARAGVVAGFVLVPSTTVVYDSVDVTVGYDPDTGDPIVETTSVPRVVGTLTPTLTRGVLFAQGAMWRPAGSTVTPAVTANALRYLHYNSIGGLYWSAFQAPSTSDDATLGWVRTDGTGVIAVSSRRLGSGELDATLLGPIVPTPTGGDGASPVATISAVDASTISTSDPNYQPHWQTNFTVYAQLNVQPAGIDSFPTDTRIWIDKQHGDGPEFQGVWHLADATDIARIQSLAESDPTTDHWTVWALGGVGGSTETPPVGSVHADFTPPFITAPTDHDVTAAEFVADPDTGDIIEYSIGDNGTMYWNPVSIQWTQPNLTDNPDFGYTMISVIKGGMIAGVWTPAPDYEGKDEKPGLYIGRWITDSQNIPGSPGAGSVCNFKGPIPANWTFPPVFLDDGVTPNPYRDFRIYVWSISLRGSGPGSVGTIVAQTSCWAGGAAFGVLTPTDSPAGLIHAGRLNSNTMGPSLTVRGGQLIVNTGDTSNTVNNPGGENGNKGWEFTLNSAIQPSAGGVSGNARFYFTPTGGGAASLQEAAIERLVIPGQQWYGDSVWSSDSGATGTERLQAVWYDKNKVVLTSGSVVDFGSAAAPGPTWTSHIGGVVTVPAGASYLRLRAKVDAGATLGHYCDNFVVQRVVGASQMKLGDGLLPDGSDRAVLNVGGGLVLVDGQAKVNPSAVIGVNGSNQVVVNNNSLSEGFFVGGALGTDPTKWASTAGYYGIYNGLPTITSSIPNLIINTATTPFKLFRKNSGVWAAVMDPGDLIAGTIVALVQLISPTLTSAIINGGAIHGATLDITSGTVTVNIDNSNYIMVTDTAAVSQAGVKAAGPYVVRTDNANARAELAVTGGSTGRGRCILKSIAGHQLILEPIFATTATGGFATLPANPAGFWSIQIDGGAGLVPYYRP